MAQVGAPNPDVELPFADISGTQDIDLRPAAVLKKKPPAKSQPSTRALAQEAPIGKGMQQKLCPKAVELLQSMPRCQLFFFVKARWHFWSQQVLTSIQWQNGRCSPNGPVWGPLGVDFRGIAVQLRTFCAQFCARRLAA